MVRGCAGSTHKSAEVTLEVHLAVLVAQESICSYMKCSPAGDAHWILPGI